MKVTQDQVEKALESLEASLAGGDEESVIKASEDDLDQAEGADLGNPVKEKMSDAAKSAAPEAEADDDESEEETEKSFADEMPEEIQTKIDVSEFLKSLVNHTGTV